MITLNRGKKIPGPRKYSGLGTAIKVTTGTMSRGEAADLTAAGLMRAEPEPTTKLLPIGTRISITNGLYPWIKVYKEGETGEITKVIPSSPSPSTGKNDPGDYVLYQVWMDKHKEIGLKEMRVLLRGWEVTKEVAE